MFVWGWRLGFGVDVSVAWLLDIMKRVIVGDEILWRWHCLLFRWILTIVYPVLFYFILSIYLSLGFALHTASETGHSVSMEWMTVLLLVVSLFCSVCRVACIASLAFSMLINSLMQCILNIHYSHEWIPMAHRNHNAFAILHWTAIDVVDLKKEKREARAAIMLSFHMTQLDLFRFSGLPIKRGEQSHDLHLSHAKLSLGLRWRRFHFSFSFSDQIFGFVNDEFIEKRILRGRDTLPEHVPDHQHGRTRRTACE